MFLTNLDCEICRQVKVSSVLGNIKRNASGAIVGAQVGMIGYGVDKKLALGTVNAWCVISSPSWQYCLLSDAVHAW